MPKYTMEVLLGRLGLHTPRNCMPRITDTALVLNGRQELPQRTVCTGTVVQCIAVLLLAYIVLVSCTVSTVPIDIKNLR
jgi:hypothetical protein